MSLLEVSIGEDVAAYDELLDALVRDRVASRIFEKDATLWGDAAEDEARIRLGWTTFAEAAAEIIPDIEDVRAEFASAGVDRIVLCGMGGSSLAPAVIARWAGVELTMIDSTHPAVIERVLGGDLARTAVVVSSKSGSTIETRSHLAAFEQAFRDAGIDSRVVIVTDPDRRWTRSRAPPAAWSSMPTRMSAVASRRSRRSVWCRRVLPRSI